MPDHCEPRLARLSTAQIANLNRRAVETAITNGKKRVQWAMAQTTSCILHVTNTLDSLGYTFTTERLQVNEEPDQSYQAAAAARRSFPCCSEGMAEATEEEQTD